MIAAVRLMQREQVEFNILCTVNNVNSLHPLEVYRFFRDELGARYVQLIPIVERINDDGRNLLQQGRRVRGHSSLCIFRPTCGDGVALEHNGDLYSCDHFVEPKHLLGNILNTPLIQRVNSDQQRRFERDKQTSLPKYCRECSYLFACNGECPKNRFLTTPDGEEGLNYLCAGLKAYFEHVDPHMRVLADLLRRGRPASDIMALH